MTEMPEVQTMTFGDWLASVLRGENLDTQYYREHEDRHEFISAKWALQFMRETAEEEAKRGKGEKP